MPKCAGERAGVIIAVRVPHTNSLQTIDQAGMKDRAYIVRSFSLTSIWQNIMRILKAAIIERSFKKNQQFFDFCSLNGHE